jgi:transmembrane sensor
MFVKFHFMEDSNLLWSTLLIKYVNNELTQAELKELERQMSTSLIKQRQFKELTDPEEFIKLFQDLHSINTEEPWKRLVAAHPFLEKPPTIRFYKKKAFKEWMLRAAIVIGLFSIGSIYIYFFRTNYKASINFKPTAKEDILPLIKNYSYIKAVTGSEYNLETAGTGVLYESRGIKLIYRDTMLEIEAKDPDQSGYNEIFDLVTAPCKQLLVQFPDGSRIRLNAATTVRFPLLFSKNERRVNLYGEALFDVASNRNVPFVVGLKGGLEAQATGTIFNISSYENENVTTTLITGEIKMVYERKPYPVKKGQQAEFTKDKKIRIIEKPDYSKAVAWTRNEFAFDNIDIKEMMREIGRFYHYKIVFKDSLPDMASGGVLPTDKKLDDIITVLETQNKIKIQPEGDSLIVSRKH